LQDLARTAKKIFNGKERSSMRTVLRSRSKKSVVTGLVLFAVVIVGFLVGHARADQPHMQAALEHLRAAKRELEIAEADKGGHRARAIRLVDDAIVQVEKGVRYDRAR
jgi:hypothetical protein